MNEEDLIARLRRTLHERAEALQPRPGQVPVAGTEPVGEAAWGGAAPAGATGPAGPEGPLPYDEPETAEYPSLPPTGPVPIWSGGRRRWPALVAAGAVVAAAAATITALALTGGRNPVRVQPSVSTGPGITVSSPTSATPATSAPASVPATTSAPPASVRPVPAGFQPYSVTFVSEQDGWSLGWAPCGSRRCATLAATIDGGRTWSAVNAPAITSAAGDTSAFGGAPYFQIRFSDRSNGWIWTAPGRVPVTSSLWSTHDGGTTWSPVAVPLAGGTIGDLEAAGGLVHMAVYGPCPAGTAGCQGQAEEEILTTPATTDRWSPSPLKPAIGAGPVLSPQLTLWGSDGWLVNNNRTVVSGARLSSGGGWTDWTPACSTAGGPGVLGASSATDLVAVCAEGLWGTPDPNTLAGHSWLFRSTDGGNRFQPVGQVPGNQPQSVTVTPGNGQTIVVADSQGDLVATFDGGANWTTVAPAGATSGGPATYFGFVGFTTSTQGVAVQYQPTPTLYMTRDGGHHWNPVSF